MGKAQQLVLWATGPPADAEPDLDQAPASDLEFIDTPWVDDVPADPAT